MKGIVYTKSAEYLRDVPVGRSIRFKMEAENCSYPDLMMRFRIDPEKASPEFIEHKLKSFDMRTYFTNHAAGSSGTMIKINKSVVEKAPILLPPLPEQKKIAQILSTWDKAITITEKLLADSQQQKKALMQQLLTGKRRFFGFGGGWEQAQLKSIAKITKGRALSSKDLINGVYPVIAGGKTSPYSHGNFTHENVITVSASGAYAGYVAYHGYKIWASDCSVVEAKKSNDITFIYQLFLLNQGKIYSLQSGGAQPHIYPKDLDGLIVQTPSLEEQQKIASSLSKLDKGVGILKQNLAYLTDEKRALMQQLLTGKKRVLAGGVA